MGMLKYIADKLYSNDKLVSVVGETAVNGGIESGVSGNTTWVKYPDGTMIEYGFITPATSDSNNLHTFLNAFVGTVPVTVASNRSSSDSFVEIKIAATSLSNFQYGVLTKSSGSTAHIWNTGTTNHYIAIGRWK